MRRERRAPLLAMDGESVGWMDGWMEVGGEGSGSDCLANSGCVGCVAGPSAARLMVSEEERDGLGCVCGRDASRSRSGPARRVVDCGRPCVGGIGGILARWIVG